MKLRGTASGRTLAHSGRMLMVAAVIAAAACAPTSTGSDAGGSTGSGDAAWQPDRPVTFVVATGVGGGGDLFGRAAAQGISTADPKAKIAVENHTGGDEVVGVSYVLSHKDDPYYMFVANSSLLLQPYSIKPPPDYSWQSFTPVAELAEDQQVLVVPANSPYQNLSDLINAAKTQKLRISVTSATGTDNACSRLLEKDQNVEFQHVILESGSAGVAAMLAGNVDFSILNPSEAKGQIDAKTLRPLAVFSDKRYDKGSGLEDIPTAKEQGVNVVFVQFRGLLAPGKITEPQLSYWEKVSEDWTKTPGYADYINKNSLQPAFKTGSEFTDLLNQQTATFKETFGG
jgi:putative tricarboxylic transport membrane protein